MRSVIFTGLTLAMAFGAAPAGAQDMPPPGGPGGPMRGGRVFISPMGEPFRSMDGEPAPNDKWFDGADADHDGVVTHAEFQADALRFFARLDMRQDGEIDPDDIDRYETVMAPEVRVVGGGGGAVARRGPVTGSIIGTPGSNPGDRARMQGAARYSWFTYPQPITVADRNFNRGVDPREFVQAATLRFDLLDTNRDGKLTKAELPPYEAPEPEKRRGRRR